MYYIYSDEAGTSANEPVTVVVGIVVHADRHWRAASDALAQVISKHVPASLSEGFIFHAKEIWSGYRDYDASWPREQRSKFIGDVAAIPRMLGMAIAIGKVRRDSDVPEDIKPMKKEDFQHYMAFNFCMRRANKYINDWAEPSEVATIVAEDIPKKKITLKNSLKAIPPIIPLTSEFIIPTRRDKLSGKILQTRAEAINRVIDTVHFVQKNEAPLLQLADACAFSFRRYFAEQQHGNDMVLAMLGQPLVWEDWQGPGSEVTFSFNPEHLYPKST